MEMFDGCILVRLVVMEGVQVLVRVCCMMVVVVKVFSEAYKLGIIYCDLKFDNIFMLDEMGDEGFKIFDFGIAKVIDEIIYEILMQIGFICGTFFYIFFE